MRNAGVQRCAPPFRDAKVGRGRRNPSARAPLSARAIDGCPDFFDELENEFCNNIDWAKVKDITQKVTGCKVKTFKGDKSLIIENEEMNDEEVKDYIEGEMECKVNLEHINQGLKVANVKLEFIEAMLLPFDADGFQNIVRFKVVELDK